MSEEIKEKLDLFPNKMNDIAKEAYYQLEDYITNLQQKVEQLEKENKELKDENKRIFQNVNDDELLISNAMNYAELKKAEKRVEQLENIRKEAIEYLKDEGNIIDRFWKHDFREYPDYDPFNAKDEEEVRCVELYGYDDLLNILNKGEISKYE